MCVEVISNQMCVKQRSRKHVQQLKKRKTSWFLDFETNVKNAKSVRTVSEET